MIITCLSEQSLSSPFYRSALVCSSPGGQPGVLHEPGHTRMVAHVRLLLNTVHSLGAGEREEQRAHGQSFGLRTGTAVASDVILRFVIRDGSDVQLLLPAILRDAKLEST